MVRRGRFHNNEEETERMAAESLTQKALNKMEKIFPVLVGFFCK